MVDSVSELHTDGIDVQHAPDQAICPDTSPNSKFDPSICVSAFTSLQPLPVQLGFQKSLLTEPDLVEAVPVLPVELEP